jgi:C4-dicarboxylate-binding protein DctP
MTGVSGVKSRKLWEVMDTITVTNNADIEFIVVVNTEWWDALPAGHRDAIHQAAVIAENHVRNEMASIEAEAYELSAANGMTIYHPTDAEIAAWKAASTPVYDGFKAKAGDLGAQVLKAAEGL